MSKLAFYKLTALPQVLEANSLYMVVKPATSHFDLYVTSTDGQTVRQLAGAEISFNNFVVKSSTAPSLPSEHTFWEDTTTGDLYYQKTVEGISSWDNLSDEPVIAPGTTDQFLRGDKTWKTLEMSDIKYTIRTLFVEAATTKNLECTDGMVGPYFRLTSTKNEALIIDGITLKYGSSVLLKDQLNAAHNGIYRVYSTGGSLNPWFLERIYQLTSALIEGINVTIVSGTVNKRSTFSTTFKSTDILNTTPMLWFKEPAFNYYPINIQGISVSAYSLFNNRSINGVVFNGTENITINAVDSTPRIASSEKGTVNGVASLDASGKVPSEQLPSYVDDALEYDDLETFPVEGETGKIYVALDTNKVYRWSGSSYIYITSGAVDSVAGKTGVVTLTKSDVGLANVDNTTDANKPVSTAQQTALDLKANLESPNLTGTPTAPTPITGTSNGQVATTAFVNFEIGNYAAPIYHVGSIGTAHGVATQVENGFMSSTDKTKLDGIASNANNYSLPMATSTTLGGVKDGTGVTIDASGVISVDYGSTANTAVEGNDARVTADQAVTTASIRTLGTGALQAAAGNHTHPPQTNITGNAFSATKLATYRLINGIPFDGTGDIDIIPRVIYLDEYGETYIGDPTAITTPGVYLNTNFLGGMNEPLEFYGDNAHIHYLTFKNTNSESIQIGINTSGILIRKASPYDTAWGDWVKIPTMADVTAEVNRLLDERLNP